MTESDIKRIAAEVADETIRKFLLALGVDATNGPSVIELQKDFAHIRESRLAIAAVKTKAYLVITGTVVTALIGAVWLSLTSKIH